MPHPTVFTPEDIWHGGYFELSVELGHRSDERLRTALDTLWKHQSLNGCYMRRDVEPENQKRVALSDFNFDDGWGGHCLGIATLPNDKRIACGTCVIRETDGPDWLDLYLPMGAIGTAYDIGGFPFLLADDPPAAWINDLEPWLAGIATSVADVVPYRMAIIGFEVSGQYYASDLSRDGIPDTRYIGYIWPDNGTYNYFNTNADVRDKPNV